MKTNIRLAIGSALAMLMLAACNSGLSASLPADSSATAAAPDAATVSATSAPESTSAALQATVADTASQTTSDTPLGAALLKFGAVGSYRAEMEMKGQGAIGLSTDDTNPNSPETSLFVLSGDFKGPDSHYTLKGFLSSLLGVDPNAGMEAMIAGGKDYVKGPISMLGATDAKWYVLQGDQSAAIVPPFQVSEFLAALGNSDVQLGSFKSAGNETLDGKKCDILSGDKTEAAKTLTALGAGSLPGVADITNIDNATARFSLCDDGYIHRILLTLDTSTKDKPILKASFTVNIHMYDYNAAITITPPSDASALDATNIVTDTTTPSK
ncbi:MAG TPA: hypothetical protein VGK81_12550 [Anaerolineae bacterium]